MTDCCSALRINGRNQSINRGMKEGMRFFKIRHKWLLLCILFILLIYTIYAYVWPAGRHGKTRKTHGPFDAKYRDQLRLLVASNIHTRSRIVFNNKARTWQQQLPALRQALTSCRCLWALVSERVKACLDPPPDSIDWNTWNKSHVILFASWIIGDGCLVEGNE